MEKGRCRGLERDEIKYRAIEAQVRGASSIEKGRYRGSERGWLTWRYQALQVPDLRDNKRANGGHCPHLRTNVRCVASGVGREGRRVRRRRVVS
jgi:hypothetical protein